MPTNKTQFKTICKHFRPGTAKGPVMVFKSSSHPKCEICIIEFQCVKKLCSFMRQRVQDFFLFLNFLAVLHLLRNITKQKVI